MLIDHVGLIFFPDVLIFRIIGRLAMPIYIFLATLAIDYTSNFKRYCNRLLTIACLAQLPYMWAFQTTQLNIVFNIFLGAIVIHYVKKGLGSFKNFIITSGLSFFTVVLSYLYIEYSFYCLFLMLGFYLLKIPYLMITFHFILNLIFFIHFGWLLQVFSLAATVVILMRKKLPKVVINKSIYRLFYPVHLLVLGIVSIMF